MLHARAIIRSTALATRDSSSASSRSFSPVASCATASSASGVTRVPRSAWSRSRARPADSALRAQQEGGAGVADRHHPAVPSPSRTLRGRVRPGQQGPQQAPRTGTQSRPPRRGQPSLPRHPPARLVARPPAAVGGPDRGYTASACRHGPEGVATKVTAPTGATCCGVTPCWSCPRLCATALLYRESSTPADSARSYCCSGTK